MAHFKLSAVILALLIVLVVTNAKPLSETESDLPAEIKYEDEAVGNGLKPSDVEALIYFVQGLAFNEHSENLSPEARGWWSRFRKNYLQPAIPSIVGAVLSRG